MKKIIILYSTGGMGHKKAAKALYDAFSKMSDKVEVKNIDTLNYGNRFYKFLYIDFYVFMMTRARWLWGILYYSSDKGVVDRFLKKMRRFFDIKCMRGLEKMLIDEKPDAIIATHFILPGIAEVLKEVDHFTAKLCVVITDYGPHGFWLSRDIDTFFVGTESVKPYVEERGVPPEKIIATGIPTVKEFTENKFDISALQKKYKLDKGRKTIFMLTGGFGVGPMEEMLKALTVCTADIQVITVCGHNEKAYDDIKKLKENLNYPVILFGFTDKVAELMAVSDLMITKAGGISVTEALNMRLPMLLIASMPGQETWNEELLLKSGAAEKARSVKEVPDLVNKIFLSKDIFEHMQEGIDRLRRPRAAEDIVKYVLKEIGE